MSEPYYSQRAQCSERFFHYPSFLFLSILSLFILGLGSGTGQTDKRTEGLCGQGIITYHTRILSAELTCDRIVSPGVR